MRLETTRRTGRARFLPGLLLLLLGCGDRGPASGVGQESAAAAAPPPSPVTASRPSSEDGLSPPRAESPPDREVEGILDRIAEIAVRWEREPENYEGRAQWEKESTTLAASLATFGRRALEPLRRRIESPSNVFGLRVFLGAWIDGFPENAFPELERIALDSRLPGLLRVEALRALVPRIPERAVDLLGAAVMDPSLRSFEGRYQLLALLEQSGDSRAAGPLLAIFLDPSEAVETRMQAGLSLTVFPSAETAGTLERVLRDEAAPPALRVRAFQSLYHLLRCDIVRLAREILEDARAHSLRDVLEAAIADCS